MYVALQVGVFFPLLFFLKVTFACMNGMCSNLILRVFSFCFHMKKKKKSSGVEEFQFVLVSQHHEFLVVKMFSSGPMKILLVSLKNEEMKYLDLQYLDIFHSNATYVKGCKKSSIKMTEKHYKVESFAEMLSYHIASREDKGDREGIPHRHPIQ